MFDKATYNPIYEASLKTLAKSEKVTRQELLTLSRSVLEAVHATEDIGYVNRLLAVLTPVNRKVCVLYFAEFTGFKQDEGTFTKKDKKNYDEAAAKAAAWLEDPLNNVWTWADRNVQVEAKPFDLAKVTQMVGQFIKKAEKEQITQVQVLRAVFAAGFDPAALVEAMKIIAEDTVKA